MVAGSCPLVGLGVVVDVVVVSFYVLFFGLSVLAVEVDSRPHRKALVTGLV